MGIKFEKKNSRILVIAILLAVSCFMTYYFHRVLGLGTVFTHFFYIPIILAAIWWKRRGLLVAAFLAAVLIFGHLALRGVVLNYNDYIRAVMFIVVAYFVVWFSEQIAKKEERIEHLNLVLRAIRNVNQLIAVEKDRDRLLKRACDIIIETRGYYNSWIALLDDSGKLIKSAEAGLGKNFLPLVERLKRGELTACGRRAQSEPGIVVTEDPASACSDCPLANNYVGKAAMTVRLEYGGKVYGLFSLSIPKDFTTDEEEKALLKEVAADIAFALHSLEMEEEHKRADAIREVLLKISKATIKTSSLDDLLAAIHEQVDTFMDANNFFVCLAHNTEKNLYTFPYYRDINPEDIVEPSEIFEITEGLTHHVLKTKEYLLGNKEELKKIGVIGTVPESWLGVPLKTESGDINGIVAVQSYEKEAYSEEDAQVLSIIASNIAGVLKYKKAEEQIKSSLREKEILLQEIHHRVKNNLQVISSLLKLQSEYIKDKQVSQMFKDSQNRIKSMALIHEKLYLSKDLMNIDLKDYIQDLTYKLFRSYEADPSKIALRMDVKDVSLRIDTAIPCGLIINELVSNSLKHAFLQGREGEIKVALRSIDKNEIELKVKDNGVGLPEDFDFRKTKSLGLHIVTILAEDQLDGKIELNRAGGTEFKITFKRGK